MKSLKYASGLLVLMALLALAPACSKKSPTQPDPAVPEQPPDLPPLPPAPRSMADVLPSQSADHPVGLSAPMGRFEPFATELRMMQDDRSVPWVTVNRRVKLVCNGVLAEHTSDPGVANRPYVVAAPRLLHERYWKLAWQVAVQAGGVYDQTHSLTIGTSRTREETREFSWTLGVEIESEAGIEGLKHAVKQTFQQTATLREVNSVTFKVEEQVTRRFSLVPSDRDRVLAVWQLVDKFTLVDADSLDVHSSSTLRHARIRAVGSIELVNERFLFTQVTSF